MFHSTQHFGAAIFVLFLVFAAFLELEPYILLSLCNMLISACICNIFGLEPFILRAIICIILELEHSISLAICSILELESCILHAIFADIIGCCLLVVGGEAHKKLLMVWS